MSALLGDWDGSPIRFVGLYQAAQVRGEVCFGVRKAGGEEGVCIIPPKDRLFELRPEAQWVVLAEDES